MVTPPVRSIVALVREVSPQLARLRADTPGSRRHRRRPCVGAAPCLLRRVAESWRARGSHRAAARCARWRLCRRHSGGGRRGGCHCPPRRRLTRGRNRDDRIGAAALSIPAPPVGRGDTRRRRRHAVRPHAVRRPFGPHEPDVGINELGTLLAPWGYRVEGVDLDGCLHLKTACTFVPPHYLLANPAWVDARVFAGLTPVAVADDEPFAGNTLTLGGVTLVASQCPRTAALLRARGVITRDVDLSELAKAEGRADVLEPDRRGVRWGRWLRR